MSIFDVALAQFGSIEQAFDLALENNISLTDNIAGKMLNTTLVATNPATVNYYRNNNVMPATAAKSSGEGIGYWAIGIDFVVS